MFLVTGWFRLERKKKMDGIDWNRYAQICENSSADAIERFAASLRRAVSVATNQSIPIYEGEMRGSLVTVLRRMTDILKRFAAEQMPEQEQKKLRWKDVEDRMREAYFARLSRIGNMQVAVEYVNTRLQGKPSDRAAVYQWVNDLQSDPGEIDRIIRRTSEETGAFAREDVPGIMEVARLGIRMRHPVT